MSKKKLTAKDLVKKGFPYAVAMGITAAIAMGWGGKPLEDIKNYYEIKALFPSSGIVTQVEDGDTFILKSGIKVRLLGINTPERGQKNYSEATNYLSNQLINHPVYLEYDRYQDDIYSRVLAWVWINCESTPKFLPADYMHKSGNESMPGLIDNPTGCKKGKLINEELVKANFAEVVSYTDRGELKYEQRISSP